MAFSFIGTLSESKLLPTKISLTRRSVTEISQFTYLNIIALYILLSEDESEEFARKYARRTIQWNSFETWRQDASDLYVLLHSIKGQDHDEEWDSYPLSQELVVQWLRDAAFDNLRTALTKRLFSRLDFDLKIKDESMRAIRRLVQDWDSIDDHKKQLAMTRLLQKFRLLMPKSELLPMLKSVAAAKDLQIKNANNPDLDDLDDLAENASAGATGAANVATSVGKAGGIGAGFDPDGDHGIYQNAKKKKKTTEEEKPAVIKRNP